MVREIRNATLFRVSPAEARAWRDTIAARIEGSHVGVNGSYEEGVIDTIAWMLGEDEKPCDLRRNE